MGFDGVLAGGGKLGKRGWRGWTLHHRSRPYQNMVLEAGSLGIEQG